MSKENGENREGMDVSDLEASSSCEALAQAGIVRAQSPLRGRGKI